MKSQYFMARAMRYWMRRYPSERGKKFLCEHFRKWCPADEVLTSTQEGFSIFASPRNYASYSIYFMGVYDMYMTNFMKAHIVEGNTCWDIGTDRGWFTLLMASLVGSRGRVDAFEAFPPNYKKLTMNIESNQFTWIKANNLAISDKTGERYFVPPSDEITHHVGYLNECSGVGYLTSELVPGSILVHAISIDEYAQQHPLDRLDLIKLDIEGAEYSGLVGARDTIERFRPKLLVEYNQETSIRAGNSIEELDVLLENLRYDRYTFRGKLEKLNLENWRDKSENNTVFNVYCLPRP